MKERLNPEDKQHLRAFLRIPNTVVVAEKLFAKGAELVTLTNENTGEVLLKEADSQVIKGIKGGAERLYEQLKPYKTTCDVFIEASKKL